MSRGTKGMIVEATLEVKSCAKNILGEIQTIVV